MAQKKILFFVYDGIGGGHLRRMCRIAEALQGDLFSCLVVSGHREMSWMVSKKCEYVHLPNTRVLVLNGLHGTTPFFNFTSLDEILDFRKRQLQVIFETFRPDAIFTDYQPVGFKGELKELIENYPAKKYFIARGIMGNSEGYIRDVIEFKGHFLRDFYERIFVTCDGRVSNFVQECRLPKELAEKVNIVGYVAPNISQTEICQIRSTSQVRGKWVVCSGGTGHLSEELVPDFLHLAHAHPDITFDIVLGSRNAWPYPLTFFPFQKRKNVRIWRENVNLEYMHAACDIVICPGSYNSLVESFQGQASVIVRNIPSRHDDEPVVHALKLKPWINIRTALSRDDLFTTFQEALSDKPTPHNLDCNGTARIKEQIVRDLIIS